VTLDLDRDDAPEVLSWLVRGLKDGQGMLLVLPGAGEPEGRCLSEEALQRASAEVPGRSPWKGKKQKRLRLRAPHYSVGVFGMVEEIRRACGGMLRLDQPEEMLPSVLEATKAVLHAVRVTVQEPPFLMGLSWRCPCSYLGEWIGCHCGKAAVETHKKRIQRLRGLFDQVLVLDVDPWSRLRILKEGWTW